MRLICKGFLILNKVMFLYFVLQNSMHGKIRKSNKNKQTEKRKIGTYFIDSNLNFDVLFFTKNLSLKR